MGGAAAAGTGATAGIATAPVMLGGAYLSARSLGDRRVVSTLLAAANANSPTVQATIVRRIGAVAAREPALANELLPIQRLLSQTIGGTRPALAEQGNDQRQAR